MDCIFCKIAKGDLPSHKVWESDTHVAFLNIFPIYKGMTVVIPKDHQPSNVAAMSDEAYSQLFEAAREVAKKIEAALGVERCCFVAEGTGINHAHIKLYPLHGYQPGDPIQTGQDKVFEEYPGYITTVEGPRADDDDLAQIAKQIRGE